MAFAASYDGTRIYYEKAGHGEPLLLVSGQGADHTYWDIIRDDFAGRYQVVVYDNRGTGHSDKPDAPEYTTRMFAHDAVAVLDHLGVGRAHVYGHSMGGRIAQWLAVDHEERIASLVLGGTTPGNARGVPREPEIDQLLTHPPADAKEAYQALASLVLSPSWLSKNPDIFSQLTQGTRLPDYVRRLHYQASETHDCWDYLPLIHTPTLVIHGSDDKLNPTDNASLLAGRIPHAELCIIQGGRHGYMFEFREESNRIVSSFLERNRLS